MKIRQQIEKQIDRCYTVSVVKDDIFEHSIDTFNRRLKETKTDDALLITLQNELNEYCRENNVSILYEGKNVN